MNKNIVKHDPVARNFKTSSASFAEPSQVATGSTLHYDLAVALLVNPDIDCAYTILEFTRKYDRRNFQKECAWCGKVLKPGHTVYGESHGICHACSEIHFPKNK